MSKIALKMVEEMQFSWKYGQRFHPDSTEKLSDWWNLDLNLQKKMWYEYELERPLLLDPTNLKSEWYFVSN